MEKILPHYKFQTPFFEKPLTQVDGFSAFDYNPDEENISCQVELVETDECKRFLQSPSTSFTRNRDRQADSLIIDNSIIFINPVVALPASMLSIKDRYQQSIVLHAGWDNQGKYHNPLVLRCWASGR
jgi:hypothetical protein